MKIHYDSKADALDISLKKGRVHETREISPEFFVDVNKKGEPLSLEIIGASEKFLKKELTSLKIDIEGFPVKYAT